MAKKTVTRSEYPAKRYHTVGQSPTRRLFTPPAVSTSVHWQKAFTTACAPSVPTVAPTPLVIRKKRACALERIEGSVSRSTKSEPEILKKSKATP